MRRIVRPSLPRPVAAYLERKQAEVNRGKPARPTWDQARRTKTMGKVAVALGTMAGTRSRCMFCEDSRGNDIDHYRPLATFPRLAFVWVNLLWLCTGCNRLKGQRFETNAAGLPLLINPTTEDPWDYLFFDPHTGQITARFRGDTAAPDPRGQHTTDPSVLPLNIEAVTEGRQRTYRNLRRAVDRFLEVAVSEDTFDAARSELLDAVRDADAFGLANWCFARDGNRVNPFQLLRDRHLEVWQAVVASL